jgi:O-antigen/teichoic acid export membrane protein
MGAGRQDPHDLRHGEGEMNSLARRARVLLQFLFVQGLTLFGNLIYGILCVRLLPASEYAKFVVVFSVAGTLVVLMDVNISTSLAPLIGERINDRKLIADYVASLRQLSHIIFAVVATGTVAFFPFLVKHRGWDTATVVTMIVILLVATWFIRVGAAYGTTLVLLRERTLWYRGQMGQSYGTLILLGIFLAFHLLTGFIAILINVAGILFIGIYYYVMATSRLSERGVGSAEKRREVIRLALPNVPGSIFYALQGQISLFLITFFGHTVGVASVGALARLANIFALLSKMNPMLVEPYFAKLPEKQLKRDYSAAIVLAAAGCAVITLFAWLWPEAFLWVLGSQYRDLRVEVLLVIASGGLSTLAGMLYCINSARRFVYWWNVGANMIAIVAAQAACIMRFDMGAVRGVLLLNLFTNLASLGVNLSAGVYGFIYGPREVNSSGLSAAVREQEIAAQPEFVEESGSVTLPVAVPEILSEPSR